KKDHAGRPYADLSLKLDKTAQPIRTTTILTIRPRSPLGLKYVELQPGRGGRPLPQNGKLAQSQATPAVDLDEVLGTFDQTTRRSLQLAVAGLGNAAAGRGADLNASVTALPELFKRTRSVAANVADPR